MNKKNCKKSLITLIFNSSLLFGILTNAAPSASYQKFLKEKGIGDGIPDFSHAGYNGKAEKIPEITKINYKYFDVTNYGALPNDKKSDRQSVIKTITAAEKYAGKAVIFFPKGRFILRSKSDMLSSSIIISKDNIVIQGSGMYLNGTELVSQSPSFAPVISFRCKNANERWSGYELAQVPKGVKRGTSSVVVDNVSKLKEGQYVNITALLSRENDAKMQRYFAPHQPSKLFLADVKKRPWARKIKGRHCIKNINITTKTVTFTEPIQFDYTVTENITLSTDFKDSQRYLHNVGIENLAMTADFKELYAHYKNLLVDGYNFINMSYTINSWGRHLRLRSYTNAIRPSGGMYNTFYDIQLEGNVGHMSISGYDSYGNLYAYVRELTDSHHGLGGTDNHVNGVFLRCVQAANLEAHCKFPHATLFDVNEGKFNNLRMGGAQKTPQHGPDLVYWNWNNSNSFFGNGYDMIADLKNSGSIDFWPEGARYGFVLPPYIIGLHGIKVVIKDASKDAKLNENQELKVSPESLFEAQLTERLGSVPEWIKKRSNTFEKISRYSRIQFASPTLDSNYKMGQIVNIKAKFHPKFNKANIKKVELYQCLSFDFDLKRAKIVYTSKNKSTARFKCKSKGAKFLFLVLTNTLDEQMISDPLVINVTKNSLGNSNANNKFIKPIKVYFGTGLTKSSSRNIFGKANKEASKVKENSNDNWLKKRQKTYLIELRKQEVKDLKESFKNKKNQKHAKKVFDGDEKTSFSLYNGYATAYIFDLGYPQGMRGVQLVLPQNIDTTNLALEIQTSNNPKSLLSAHNNDNYWTTQRRVGKTLINHNYQIKGNKINLYMTMTKARFVRIWVRRGNIKISEIKIISY